ncbi:MAG: hypothetical protein P4L03_07180 [Terracidiphilus sp.]|nr:hypothetical protein [Terracidiphilus sp.]
MSGRSQHVTIPREFRFHSAEVAIRRDPDTGDIILSEGPGSWSQLFEELDAIQIPSGFLSGAERDRRPPEPRPSLDRLFDESDGRTA